MSDFAGDDSHPPDAPGLAETTLIAKVPVIAERVVVHKTMADAGGVRVHKRVHEDAVTLDEPLLKQSVESLRVPVGREVDGPVAVRYEGDVTIIPVVEERLVVRRQLVLVEEIHLTPTTGVFRAPQTVPARREEVVVERQDPASGAWRAEPSRAARK